MQLVSSKSSLVKFRLLITPVLFEYIRTDHFNYMLYSLFLASVLGVQDSHQEKIITVSGEGMVHSPDFPNTYPRNTALTWRLVAPSNMRIQLSFDERFGLEDPEDGICK